MRALNNGSRIACVRRAVVSNELFHPRFHLSTMMHFLNVLTSVSGPQPAWKFVHEREACGNLAFELLSIISDYVKICFWCPSVHGCLHCFWVYAAWLRSRHSFVK